MEAKLITDNGEVLENEFPLDKLPLVLGRGSECNLRVVDRWASRRHCEIARNNESIIVRDLGSRNGTLINGRHINVTSLNPGDKLTVGMTTFVVSPDNHKSGSGADSSTLVLDDSAAEARQTAKEISKQKPR
jgi:pSer/pThr/pTyr-binding forkhead associated (FHA) protein